MAHLPAVMNLDSLLNIVWSEILPLKDSFPNDLNNRLLNVNLSSTGKTKMRVVTYPPRGNSFVKTTDGLARLKIEQDTLQITGFVREERKFKVNENMKLMVLEKTDHGTYIMYTSWTVTLLINNLSEIPGLAGTLNPYMKQVAADYTSLTGYQPRKNAINKVNILYEPLSALSGKDKYTVYLSPKNKYHFEVIVQTGIQNVQSTFGVSASTGVGFTSLLFSRPGKSFFLLWEKYLFFERNTAGQSVKLRNDFITFQFKNRFGRIDKSPDINLSQNFSLGYLVHRDGDYLNKNTFKLGMPGLEFRNLQIQPQFIFNDFFKDFYPSIKLQVEID